jgi:DNA primase
VAARFGLGFAPPGWRTLASVFPATTTRCWKKPAWYASAGPDAPTPPGAEARRYDWFRDRVMFPIRACRGEVIGFGGRVLDDSKPKYMNSPETPVFSKGRELYGLFEARQALREKGYALVVEGYMDVVALAQSGFGNAVATLGTACTADHVHKLFRFTDAVVFSFDGDAAGRRAAAGRALEAALPHATDLRTVRSCSCRPSTTPTASCATLGAAAFEQLVTQAVPLSRQLVEQAAEGADLATAEGRSRLLAQARPLWQALPGGAFKRQVMSDLAQRAHLEPGRVAVHVGRAAAGGQGRGAAGSAAPVSPWSLRGCNRSSPNSGASCSSRRRTPSPQGRPCPTNGCATGR